MRLFALLALILLSGCATPETRLKQALVEAGLSEPMAGCMAGRMVDRLSLAPTLSDEGPQGCRPGAARPTNSFIASAH